MPRSLRRIIDVRLKKHSGISGCNHQICFLIGGNVAEPSEIGTHGFGENTSELGQGDGAQKCQREQTDKKEITDDKSAKGVQHAGYGLDGEQLFCGLP